MSTRIASTGLRRTSVNYPWKRLDGEIGFHVTELMLLMVQTRELDFLASTNTKLRSMCIYAPSVRASSTGSRTVGPVSQGSKTFDCPRRSIVFERPSTIRVPSQRSLQRPSYLAPGRMRNTTIAPSSVASPGARRQKTSLETTLN